VPLEAVIVATVKPVRPVVEPVVLLELVALEPVELPPPHAASAIATEKTITDKIASQRRGA
jgi:hypothetical protein